MAPFVRVPYTSVYLPLSMVKRCWPPSSRRGPYKKGCAVVRYLAAKQGVGVLSGRHRWLQSESVGMGVCLP
jgi:hypothetical protein